MLIMLLRNFLPKNWPSYIRIYCPRLENYLCKGAPYFSDKPIRADWAFSGARLKETGTITEHFRQRVNTGIFRQTVKEKFGVFFILVLYLSISTFIQQL